MRVRFQADADLNQFVLLAVMRRQPSVDFKTAAAARLSRLSDDEVLALAAREGSVLVTHDQSTMPHHFSQFIFSRQSAGVIIVSQRLPPIEAVDELLLIWDATDAEEWINRICYLPL
jgi:hypothetical protein